MCKRKGSGILEVNKSSLHDIDYVNIITLIIDEMYFKYPDEYSKYQITWEMCKLEIKQNIIVFSKRKHKNQVDT